MKTTLFLTAIAYTVLFAACKDDNDNNNDLSPFDRDFLTRAAHANLAEMRAGEVASTWASDKEIRDFGEQMVTDHTTAWNDLKTVAGRKDYDLPDQPDEAHRHTLEELRTRSGYSFDTTYVSSQVKDHQLAISLFQAASTQASDREVKDYAKHYLPHLEEHLEHAEALKTKLQSRGAAGQIGR